MIFGCQQSRAIIPLNYDKRFKCLNFQKKRFYSAINDILLKEIPEIFAYAALGLYQR
jgi:hypothetical protein